MHEDGLSQLRGSLKRQFTSQGSAAAPSLRLVDGPLTAQQAAIEPPKESFWQARFRTVPIFTAIISTSLLAYVLLSGQLSSPQAQLQPATQGAPQRAEQPLPEPGTQHQEAPRQGQYEVVQVGSKPSTADQTGEIQPAPAAPAVPQMPPDDVLLILIRSYLIALNQANVTGNYSVLREMGAPGFQEANSAAKLSEIFAQLRDSKLDISPIMLVVPKLFRKPEIGAKGRLRVSGYFPTEPQRVNFNLLLEFVAGRWRLFGISASTSGPKAAATPSVGVAPTEEPSVATVTVTPKASTPAETPAPPRKLEPEPKPKASESSDTAESKPSDLRDRIDRAPPETEPEQPKERSIWNPFAR